MGVQASRYVNWRVPEELDDDDEVAIVGTITDVQLGISIRKSRYFWKALIETLGKDYRVTNFSWTPYVPPLRSNPSDADTVTIDLITEVRPGQPWLHEEQEKIPISIKYSPINKFNDDEQVFTFFIYLDMDFLAYIHRDNLRDIVNSAVAKHIESYEEERRSISALAQTSKFLFGLNSEDEVKRARVMEPPSKDDKRNEALLRFMENRMDVAKEVALRPLPPRSFGPERKTTFQPARDDPLKMALQFNREMMRKGAYMNQNK